MAMANARPPRRKGNVTKVRKPADNAPGSRVPSGSEYSLNGFGGGKVKDRGVLGGAEWKNR